MDMRRLLHTNASKFFRKAFNINDLDEVWWLDIALRLDRKRKGRTTSENLTAVERSSLQASGV
jgi:hypothetical protein